MNKDITAMALKAGFKEHNGMIYVTTIDDDCAKELERFAELVRADERKVCEALHDHEDVLAPVGNSAWGEAYQEGWGQGAAAYRDAIRARGEASIRSNT